jgi:hypothetical protein
MQQLMFFVAFKISSPCSSPEQPQSSSWPHSTTWRYILLLAPLLDVELPSGLSLSLTIPKQKTVSIITLSHTCYMTRPIIYFYLITRKMNEEYITLSCSLCSFLHSPVTPFFFDLNIFHIRLFTITFNLLSSFNVSD